MNLCIVLNVLINSQERHEKLPISLSLGLIPSTLMILSNHLHSMRQCPCQNLSSSLRRVKRNLHLSIAMEHFVYVSAHLAEKLSAPSGYSRSRILRVETHDTKHILSRKAIHKLKVLITWKLVHQSSRLHP